MVIIEENDELDLEPVERRGQPRGIFRGLKARILAGPGNGIDFEVLEASRIGFFVHMKLPDLLALEAAVTVRLSHEGESFTVEARVARKEVDPRRGMALRIERFENPEAEQAYLRLFAPGR
jgi:hypothetical protein